MKIRILKIILWNILIVLLLLVVLEVIVRILYPQIQLSGLNRKILEPTVYYSTVGLKQNSAGTSNGILKQVDSNRCWKYSKEIKKTNKKILILGDSATMGIGVENDSTFVGILNYNLPDVEFYNVALIGYSIQDYLNITRFLIQKKKNELGVSDICIFWCLNDIYSNFPDLNSPEQKNNIVKMITDFLVKNSKLYHLIKNIFTDRPRDYFFYDRKFYNPDNQQLNNSLNKLDQIMEIADSAKISLHLFLLPYEYQIRNYNNYDIFEPQKIFENFLQKIDVETTDCSPAFVKSNLPSNQLYLYGDGIHFSNKGHRILAEYLLQSYKNCFIGKHETK